MNHQSLPALSRFPLCHAIPGRLRVKVFQIKRSEEGAQTLRNWLAGQTGVHEAIASAVTGSVVLLYDTATWSVNSLLALLDQALLDFHHILETAPPRCVVCQFVPEPPTLSNLWVGLAKVSAITGSWPST